MVRSTLLLLVTILAVSAQAQHLPDGIVDINQHHLGVDAAGMIGFRPYFHNSNSPLISTNEVPAGSGTNAIFCGAPWFSADVEDSALAFADRFRQSVMGWMPGPVMSNQNIYQQEAILWDRVWEISRADIEDHIAHYQDVGYTPIEVIENWPGNGDPVKGQAAQLAPFEDLDNDGAYEPLEGDYPLIMGDKAVYVIFNGERQNQGTNLPSLSPIPLKVEVHTMLYGFNCAEDEILDHALFLRYQIFNRSNNTFENSRFAQWIDSDLGNPQDDYAACDVERSMFYFRNGDAQDENAPNHVGYGDSLGIIGIKVLKGAPMADDGIDNLAGTGSGQRPNGFGFGDGIIDNEASGLEGFKYHNNAAGPIGDPSGIPSDYYNYITGNWRDGTPMTFGGNGYDPNNPNAIPAKYMFPGETDPDHYGTNGINPANQGFNPKWTEQSAGNVPADRRGFGTTGPFDLEPGEDATIEWGIVFARAPWGQDSLALTEAADHVTELYNDGSFNCGNFWTLGVEEENDNQEMQLFPNPAKDFIVIQNGQALVNWKIHAQTGQLVKTGVGKRVDLADLKPGVYLLETKQEEGIAHQKFIKQ